jgi:pyridoxal phosphate enzyme (YggS family)
MSAAEAHDGPPVGRREQLAAALAALEARLQAACSAAGRRREAVSMVAVTKTRPLSDVALLHELGVADFGESKDQEARAKAAALPTVRWHFVGQLQRNKARSVASYADVVHSVDRPALVDALSDGARRTGRTIDVLLQVALSDEPERGGASPSQLPRLADHVASADGLRLTGVMAIAPLGADPSAAFARLARCAQALRENHPQATEISAGMSGDLEPAIAHGATYVRVGTALLGPRPDLLR